MKKFIITILSVAVFFVGLGGLVDRAGAKFKSDERALAIVAQARQAIGGDAAIKNVRSLTILGNAAQTFSVDGTTRTEQGNLEINLQMPNRFSKMLKLGKESASAKDGEIRRESKVIVTTKEDDNNVSNHGEGEKKMVFVNKGDKGNLTLNEGELPGGKRVEVNKRISVDGEHPRHNELLRTTFAILLTAPEGSDATYNFVGVESVDGNSCDVILVESNSSPFKLYIDQSSHLPVMMSYKGTIPMAVKFSRNENHNGSNGQIKNVIVSEDGSRSEAKESKVRVFTRKSDAPEVLGEYQIKFSDFRNVGGVQLPHKWTQTVNGQPDQTVEIISYNVNPGNISEKFNQAQPKTLMRTGKNSK